jgi:hypothetical protein
MKHKKGGYAMDQMQIARQMMEFNKTLFDNTFKAMVLLQEQTEQYAFRSLEKATWLPDDGKKAMNEWLNAYKKGREGFKAYAVESYKKAMDYFTNAQTQKERKDE